MGKEKQILEVANVKRYFIINNGFLKPKSYLKALDGVSFKVNKGETLGIVGESGCGKSTLARVIIRLIEATEGKVFIEGNNIFSLNPPAFPFYLRYNVYPSYHLDPLKLQPQINSTDFL